MSYKETFSIEATPWGDGLPETTVYLPDTLDDYRTLIRKINALGKGSKEWVAAMRLWCAADLFFLHLFVMSAGRHAYDKHSKRLLFWHPRQLQYARDVQFGVDGKGPHMQTNVAYRGMGKSSWTYSLMIQHALRDSSFACALFSFTKVAAMKHLGVISQELRSNDLLKELWSDRFFADPVAEGIGFTVSQIFIKRSSTRLEPTFSVYPFKSKLPVGSHFDAHFYDDIEDRESVRDLDSIKHTEEQFVAAQRLVSSSFFFMMNGTYYHSHGLVMKTHTDLGWKLNLLPAEDDSTEKIENAPGRGPFGYECELAHPEWLWAGINSAGGLGSVVAKREYGMQMMCNALSGETTKLDIDLIRTYDETARQLVRRTRWPIVICMDPGGDATTGKGDPTFIWAWALSPDHQFWWVDGLRQQLTPRARKLAFYRMCIDWGTITNVEQGRIESFGPSEAHSSQVEFHEEKGYDLELIKCTDTRNYGGGGGKNAGKRAREFARWETPLVENKIWFPKEMIKEDENGAAFDLVQYMKVDEIGSFPKPRADDGLDAASLIWAPESLVGPLPWPPEKISWRERDSEYYDTGRSPGSSWISAGVC